VIEIQRWKSGSLRNASCQSIF